MTDHSVEMLFRLLDQGTEGPFYIWQESPVLQKGPEWQQVATILESTCLVTLGVKPNREGRRWNIPVDRPPLTKIVNFSAAFHSQMGSSGFEAVNLHALVCEFQEGSYVLDMPLGAAANAIERRISSMAVSAVISDIAPKTGVPRQGDIKTETASTIKQLAPDLPEEDSEDQRESPTPDVYLVIGRVRERLQRNLLTDSAAIRQLCDVVDAYEDVWFTRAAFDTLVEDLKK